MTRSILCAVDLSQEAPDDTVLTTAARLAASEGAAMTVISVIPDMGVGSVASFFPADYQEKAVANAQSALDTLVETALGEAAADVTRLVAVGAVHHEVLRTARAIGCDLIVVGSHKPTTRDYVMGSNASHIVQHAPCSVYVLR